MSRTYRLFDIMQVLRRQREPVSGAELARETGVSLRTIYRDVAALQAIGADIEGEPGMGYVLRPGFLLPPMSFTDEELQALVVGAQWVSRQTDDALALAAQNAMAKISAVLPQEMRQKLDDDAIYVGRKREELTPFDLKAVRLAIRDQKKIRIVYRDQAGIQTKRVIWPVILGFVDSRRFIAGWCELREDHRLFRIDRIEEVEFLADRYPRNRRELAKEWRAAMQKQD
ncbi:MAG TPA: YafY family protein [Oculatellaceae cyanobacterium]